MSGFASDNYAGAHPEIVEALLEVNRGQAAAYGADEWTARCQETFRRHFGPEATAHPVFNGTAANVLSIAAACRPWQAVICAGTAHVHVDECGAPERLAGVKLIPVRAAQGKLTPEAVVGQLDRPGDQHAVQPRLVTISQATELGTVYGPGEIAAIAETAHEHGLLLHVDGARLGNAAAHLGASLAAITTDVGVDVVSFGGTKAGLLMGEAVVFLRAGLGDGFEFQRKQHGQLASKMRFLAAQLNGLLEDDLWLRIASHANAMARRLAAAVEGFDGVEVVHPVESNAVFARLPGPAAERLLDRHGDEFPFYVWDAGTGIVRWMCAWDTTPEEVDRFAAAVAESVRI